MIQPIFLGSVGESAMNSYGNNLLIDELRRHCRSFNPLNGL